LDLASEAKRDYYEILGVSRTAGGEEIRAAFLKLAAEYQARGKPANIEAVERFRETVRAYRILTDPEQRSRYDRLGETGVDPQVIPGGYDPEELEKWVPKFGRLPDNRCLDTPLEVQLIWKDLVLKNLL
jgi:DnaJ-class molecular chaperone